MTHILTWNPTKWVEEEMRELIERHTRDPLTIQRWKFRAHKQAQVGGRVFLMRTGQRNPGLVASGHIASEPSQDVDWQDTTKIAWYVGVRFDYLIGTASSVVVSKDELADYLKRDPKDFTPEASGTRYNGEKDALEAYWAHLTGKSELRYPDEIPTDDHDPKAYPEGALKTVTINRYERNPAARRKCLEFHGTNCKVCLINLSAIYGPQLAKNYIHVHHLKPLGEIREGYEVDPINDLVPLCPNCHAMIHLTDDPSDVDALRDRLGPRFLKLFGEFC